MNTRPYAGGADVTVLGSANVDLVFAVAAIPRPGETVLATGRHRHAGGKGLNQAVAAARAGARTVFLGAVGADEAGDSLARTLVEAGVDVGLLRRVGEPTGTALVTVQADGDNAIVVDPGANGTVRHLSREEQAAVAGAPVLVAQLEIPLSAVQDAAGVAHAAGRTVVLNAAPARAVPDELLALVDVLVVNEHEAATLTIDPAAPGGAGLVGRVPAVVVTRGAEGADVLTGEGIERVAAPRTRVVDTTGAGDAFTGALAAALAGGATLPEATRRAVVAGALAVRIAGAVPSIPTADLVERHLGRADLDQSPDDR